MAHPQVNLGTVKNSAHQLYLCLPPHPANFLCSRILYSIQPSLCSTCPPIYPSLTHTHDPHVCPCKRQPTSLAALLQSHWLPSAALLQSHWLSSASPHCHHHQANQAGQFDDPEVFKMEGFSTEEKGLTEAALEAPVVPTVDLTVVPHKELQEILFRLFARLQTAS